MKKHLIYLTIFLLQLTAIGQEKYNSLFWEISGNGLKEPSYLYGTMHSQDDRVFQFKEGVMNAFNHAEIYAMELNMDSVDQVALLSKLIMDSTHSLKTLLTEDEYTIVSDFFRDSLGQALFMFEKMQPLFTSQMVTLRDLEAQQTDALDIYFFKEAKKQKKQTIGLEKTKEQIDAFSAIPYTLQAKGLVDAVKNYGKEGELDMDTMMKYYVEGNLDKLLEMTTEYDEEDKGDEEMAKIFNDIFLIKRNHNMACRAEPFIKKGSTFIAVGAAHLPGEEGIIELLRKKGYKVIAR
jgi:uncharacterized protein YbaP (TraB family)